MENNNPKKGNVLSSKIGLVTGALLIVLGLWIILMRPESNKTIATIMVVYGTIRLGVAVYANFLRKKTTEENDISLIENEQ